MYALDNRMERREERISEVKDWTIEMAGSEQEGERDWKKNEQSRRNPWDYNERSKIHVIRVSEKKKKVVLKKNLKK